LERFTSARQSNSREYEELLEEQIPGRYLAWIDQLWTHYSLGQQGLGVQAGIWQAQQGSSQGKWQRFSMAVGWQSSPLTQGLVRDRVPGYYPTWHSEALLRRFIACELEQVMPLSVFEVVTVNAKGEEIERKWQQARFLVEDLGQGIPLEMMAIPGGTFLMGSPEDEEGHATDESPQHQVAVPPFFMGKYPVTQAQWRRVAALPRVNRRLKGDPSNFKGKDQNPVENVSWEDAVEFCDRLSAFTNRTYRLPTEAEWEYACRAGTTTPFHFGKTMKTDLANYRGQDWTFKERTYPGRYGQGPYGEFREKTTAVGMFSPNVLGLHDLHGNVWEWCQDVWHNNYDGAPIDGSAWLTGADQEDSRVLRGGAWYDDPAACRSAYRNSLARANRTDIVGFRVLCVASPGLP
jgi:formylglycine-generating enzyme required for sulfatase activity